jgi:hypothetical protein
MSAHRVRTLHLAAIGAFVMGFHLQRIMRAAIATTVGRYFSLRDSHGAATSSKIRVLKRGYRKFFDVAFTEADRFAQA